MLDILWDGGLKQMAYEFGHKNNALPMARTAYNHHGLIHELGGS